MYLSSQAKIFENFADYFLKSKTKKCFIVLKCTCKGLRKAWITRTLRDWNTVRYVALKVLRA